MSCILSMEKYECLFSFLGCPECYKNREAVNSNNQKTMEQLYKDTVRKVKYLKDQGFKVEQK